MCVCARAFVCVGAGVTHALHWPFIAFRSAGHPAPAIIHVKPGAPNMLRSRVYVNDFEIVAATKNKSTVSLPSPIAVGQDNVVRVVLHDDAGNPTSSTPDFVVHSQLQRRQNVGIPMLRTGDVSASAAGAMTE